MTATATKTARTLRWTPNADAFSPTTGALEVADRGKTTVYVVTEFSAGWPGRSFHFAKVTGGDGYDVFACRHGEEGDSCTCYAHSYRGGVCRHIAAVRKLLDLGKL